MELRKEQGKKHPDDRIIFIKTNGWEAPTFLELLELIACHINNEDSIYPHGQGGGMLISALYNKLKGKTDMELAKIYKLKMEDDMFEDEGGNYVSLKQGEEATLIIGNASKVAAKEGSVITNLSKKDYYYEVETDKGTLTVNSWALLKALSPYEAGDTVHIKHLQGKGLWEISKVEG